MAQGRTPWVANSIIFRRILSGSGRPLMKTPPSWFVRPWPAKDNRSIYLQTEEERSHREGLLVQLVETFLECESFDLADDLNRYRMCWKWRDRGSYKVLMISVKGVHQPTRLSEGDGERERTVALIDWQNMSSACNSLIVCDDRWPNC